MMPYPGGKNGSGVYQTIINRMPPHDVYVEPFLGGGAILRLKRSARLNIGVDLDPDPLARFADNAGANGLQLAGPIATIPDIDRRTAPGSAWVAGLANPHDGGLLLFNGDAFDFLSCYPFMGRELVYADPPYMFEARTSGPLYRFELTDDDHARLLDLLRTLPCMVMLSGYDTKLYRQTLHDWHTFEYQAMTRAGKPRTEILWSNFPPSADLHDYSYAGRNFRTRELLKRKTKRWTAKLQAMPDLERRALLSAIGNPADSGDGLAACDSAPEPARRRVTEPGNPSVTDRGAGSGVLSQLVLSLFPGIDLLGRGFELEGFSVVRGPDLIFGGDVQAFHAPAGRFAGIVGGSPCPDFSRKRRGPPTGQGMAMLGEFERIVKEAQPDWWLLENVPGVPDLHIAGYSHQRMDVDPRDLGIDQPRLRHFQFGHRNGFLLALPRPTARRKGGKPTLLASRSGQRSFSEFCQLQGLPEDFELPAFTQAAKFRAVGNGVHVDVARLIASAIRCPVSARARLCLCGCARPVKGRARTAGVACRKRLQRKRRNCDGSSVSRDRGVTEQTVTRPLAGNSGESQFPDRFERWFLRHGVDAGSVRPIA